MGALKVSLNCIDSVHTIMLLQLKVRVAFSMMHVSCIVHDVLMKQEVNIILHVLPTPSIMLPSLQFVPKRTLV